MKDNVKKIIDKTKKRNLTQQHAATVICMVFRPA